MMKVILGILSILIIPGSAKGLLSIVILLSTTEQIWVPLLCGIILGLILYFIFIRKFGWLTTFEHELTHALVALVFLRRIYKFVVTSREGGYVQHTGGIGGELGNFFILLAPYYLPTFTLLAALFRPIVPNNLFPWYDLFMGFTFGYHLTSNFVEIKQNWHKGYFKQARTTTLTLSDIGKVGYIFAGLFIVAIGLFFHGIILWIVKYDLKGIVLFSKIVLSYSIITFNFLFNQINLVIQYLMKHVLNVIQ